MQDLVRFRKITLVLATVGLGACSSNVGYVPSSLTTTEPPGQAGMGADPGTPGGQAGTGTGAIGTETVGSGGRVGTGTGNGSGTAGTGASANGGVTGTGTGGARTASGGGPATGSGGTTTAGSGGRASTGSGAVVGTGSGGTTSPGSGGRTTGSGSGGASSSGGTRGSGGSGMTSSPPPAGCPDAPAAGITTYYVCDCGSGADKDCVAGKDSNAGTSADAAWQTFGKAQGQFASLKAGDRIEFCKGGNFTITGTSKWVNANCKAGNRCVVASYAASWGSGDEGRPVINAPSGHAIAFDDPANADHEEGYVFAGLELVGSGMSSADGFFVYNDIDDVLICDMYIHDFGIGVQLAGSNTANAGADTHNDRIVLRDSIISDNGGDGWLGADNGSVIQNNHFQNNGFSEATFDHNIYLSMSGADGIQVIGNDLYQNSMIGGVCSSVSLVGHGVATNLLIEGNTVHEDMGTATAGCFGIAIDPGYSSAEMFTNVTIRGNTVVNVGNASIGVSACHGCTIENNVVINQQSMNGTAISSPIQDGDSDDWTNDQITIRNNSIDIDVGQGISLGTEGTGHVAVNNAIYSAGGGKGGVACFNMNLPASAYTAVNNNVCFLNGKGDWVSGQGALTAWVTKTGFDTLSMLVDPQFKSVNSPYDLSAASATSPLVNHGDVLHASATDITGKQRDATPDVGAYER